MLVKLVYNIPSLTSFEVP